MQTRGRERSLHNVEYAVVDLETTGLFPGRHDRILEIAVLRVDSSGTVLRSYESLVNPDRDVGPTHKHGIAARDVAVAPRFDEIAGAVLPLLASSVLVAHHARFELEFLRAEAARWALDLPTPPCLCTLALSRRIAPSLPSRNLAALCRHFQVPIRGRHSASGDAAAAAGLMAACFAALGDAATVRLDDLGVDTSLLDTPWPQLPVRRDPHPRGRAAPHESESPSYLERLVARLPATTPATAAEDDYYSLLDRVLEDRRVTEREAEDLVLLAREAGLARRQVQAAHRAYLLDLARAAWADSVVTERERADLRDVRRLLGLSVADLESALAEARRRPAEGSRSKEALAGKSVCFTGTLQCCVDGGRATKALAEQAARNNGMVVAPRVTRKLDLLVAADPDSMSAKAKTARHYGIRIVAEREFWRRVGVHLS